jgi:tellurite resistance protein TehA-like permease
MMDRMMDGMGAMMWGAGLLWLLVIVVLVLAAAALVKYLRSDGTK